MSFRGVSRWILLVLHKAEPAVCACLQSLSQPSAGSSDMLMPTYRPNRFLEEAFFGIRLGDRIQQVGHVFPKPLQLVWPTGQELILRLQFRRAQDVDVSLLQSSQCERQVGHELSGGMQIRSSESKHGFLYLSLSRSSFPLNSAWCLFLISSFSCEHVFSSSASCSFRSDIFFCCFAYSVSTSLLRLTLKCGEKHKWTRALACR